jgi:metal-responsive CopG/Arc/MetJ family transcriptional regulator
MAKFGVNIPDDLADEVHSELNYGDSRSEWFQQAARLKLKYDRGELDCDQDQSHEKPA